MPRHFLGISMVGLKSTMVEATPLKNGVFGIKLYKSPNGKNIEMSTIM
jgi:hypothetical protein